MDSDSESKLISLISELLLLLSVRSPDSESDSDSEPTIMPLMIQIFSLVKSMDFDSQSQPKPESKFMSLVSQTISLFHSTDFESLSNPLRKLISLISKNISVGSDQEAVSDSNFWSLVDETFESKPHQELMSFIFLILSVVISMNTELKKAISLRIEVDGYFNAGKFRVNHVCSRDSESKLNSLIYQLRWLRESTDPKWESKIMSLIIQIISVVKSKDLDWPPKPKPESKLMSLVTQAISLFHSTDFESLPKPLSEIISLISQKISTDSEQEQEQPESDLKLKSLVDETLELKPPHEIISLIRQIVYHVLSEYSKWKNIIFLSPQIKGSFEAGGEFSLSGGEEKLQRSNDLWNCFLGMFDEFRLGDITYCFCRSCNGEYHIEYEKAPLEVSHTLHRKHFLQLVLNDGSQTRECYCCGKHLLEVFYCCPTCDFGMNIACLKKPRVLSIPNPKWHDHPLTLFPRKASLTCDICALANSNSPFYICSPCDFVAHLKCINLPLVLKISRHPHRMRHTLSFKEGNWSCSVCRRKIDNDFGGYSCVKDSCSYAAHSRCATQSNVWDGLDLEGAPEESEEEEEVEPFVRISDGIIRHFSHEHHHLRLDENICSYYDDSKLCQVCITPIYFGNLYSCLQCEFVLHEACANLSRKIYHPIHPHLLSLDLVGRSEGIVYIHEHKCSGCNGCFAGGFFYECGNEQCNFRLHVQCATISKPLVHGSHKHPLFLTSKPGENRSCCLCPRISNKETFNCIECDDFALCFKCAALPQKVRYKHDKHILTLSYDQEEKSTMQYWCEACERKINPKEGLYLCGEYCCVTLHIECLIGKDLYMNPGPSFALVTRLHVLSNNQRMSRPICSNCETRCPHKIVFKFPGSILCSLECFKWSKHLA